MQSILTNMELHTALKINSYNQIYVPEMEMEILSTVVKYFLFKNNINWALLLMLIRMANLLTLKIKFKTMINVQKTNLVSISYKMDC